MQKKSKPAEFFKEVSGFFPIEIFLICKAEKFSVHPACFLFRETAVWKNSYSAFTCLHRHRLPFLPASGVPFQAEVPFLWLSAQEEFPFG